MLSRHSFVQNSNNKNLSTLVRSFINHQVRFKKTYAVPFKGKETLHDKLRGSGTADVGFPVNESMSVAVWAKGYTRIIQINRPRESNRITSEVSRDMLHQFKVLDTNPMIQLISFTGIGNGFLSAGYDARELDHLMDKGDYETIYSLIRNSHKLAYYAGNCETTTLSVINGLMIGTGASIASSANYAVATPGSIFAAPEASLGYFPDCAITRLLSEINQKYAGLGTFLGLTGAQIKSSDLIHCGLANIFGLESVAQYLADRILNIQTKVTQKEIHDCIVECTETVVPPLSFGFELYKIKEHFSNKNSVEEIIQSLKSAMNDINKTKPEREWASRILATIEQLSPLSLKIIFRAITECDNGLSVNETYQRDYRIASRLVKSKDFKQGLGAVLRGIEPVWEYESVENVPDSVVESYFKPFEYEHDKDCDLQLPEEVFLEDQILYQIAKRKLVEIARK